MRSYFALLFVGIWAGCAAAGDNASGSGAAGSGSGTTSSASGAGGASATSSATDATSSSTAGTGGATSKWSCVGSVKWPPAQAQTILIDITLKDAFTMTPLASVTVKVCAGDDPTCASPIITAMSGADGHFSAAFPIDTGGFDGYLDFTGASIQPQLAYLGPPPLVTDYKSLSFYLVSKNDFGSIHNAAGVMPDPARGAVRARAVDCFNVNAAGVHVAVAEGDAASKVVYYKATNPVGSATETDDGGLAAVVNVPAGTATVGATLSADSTVVASLPVIVRAGTLTLTPLPPTPLP